MLRTDMTFRIDGTRLDTSSFARTGFLHHALWLMNILLVQLYCKRRMDRLVGRKHSLNRCQELLRRIGPPLVRQETLS